MVVGLAVGHFVTTGAGPSPRPDLAGFTASGATDPAIVALEGRVTADPSDATGWRLLGSAYAGAGARTQDPDLIVAASDAFDRAAAIAPDDPTIVVGRGSLALTLHHFSEAETLGREAVRRLPRNADALGILVDAEVELGHYEAAADTLQRMLDARPGLPALARTSYQRELHGDLAGAQDVMRQAIVAGAGSSFDVASVTALLGELERKVGDLEGAAASYGDALTAAPDLVLAQAGRARVRAAQGDIPGAIADLQEQADAFPAPALLLVLVDLQRATADPDADATAELIRAVASLQEAAGQVVDLEMALFEADEGTDPDRALAYARAAVQARPDNVFVEDAMAWASFRAGDTQIAVEQIGRALRLGTTEPLLRYHAAEIYAASGDPSRAAEQLSVALRDPWFSFRHRDRAFELAKQLGVALEGAA